MVGMARFERASPRPQNEWVAVTLHPDGAGGDSRNPTLRFTGPLLFHLSYASNKKASEGSRRRYRSGYAHIPVPPPRVGAAAVGAGVAKRITERIVTRESQGLRPKPSQDASQGTRGSRLRCVRGRYGNVRCGGLSAHYTRNKVGHDERQCGDYDRLLSVVPEAYGHRLRSRLPAMLAGDNIGRQLTAGLCAAWSHSNCNVCLERS